MLPVFSFSRCIFGASAIAVFLLLASCGGIRSAPEDQVEGIVNDILYDKTARDQVEATIRNTLDIFYSLSEIGKELVEKELRKVWEMGRGCVIMKGATMGLHEQGLSTWLQGF